MCGDRRLADVSPDEPAAELGVDPTALALGLELSTATTASQDKPDGAGGAGDEDDNNKDGGDHAAEDDAAATATSVTLTTQTANLRISASPPSEVRALRNDAQKESQKDQPGVVFRDGKMLTCNYSSSMRRDPCSPGKSIPKSTSFFAYRNDATKFDTELAGGLEDWENVDGADVDRYGFIAVPRLSSQSSTPVDAGTSMSPPRRRPVLHKRDPASSSSRRPPSRKISARSLNTQNSGLSAASIRSSRSYIRQAGNLLPHNRDRRWMDEAGDMLTLAPNLHGAAEEAEIARISECLKHKEWERSEKWRRMAKVIRKGGQGQGMDFEFDIKNPKLIERTWKGIPDRWRATAWWSFLAASAEEHGGLPTEVEMIASFHKLLERPSPDDVQIDLDVPRTISRHIMFRRRYRGGQRLLFRVLHALSLFFPETGYVQGMASLAATLLCYFDEERCFVMLVRMWQLRGLEYLYKPGFEGLMAALKEFKESWLNKDVAKKLTELNVDITAYGTRWYLTLFNLSIPFPAQLRVWDVFLLLGDDRSSGPGAMAGARPHGSGQSPGGGGGGLSVLHATSAALIQALSEVLLDSDFENAMKALTSWIPIKDEELLMKVTKAEWKSHQGKRKT
ncbi:TBC domain-containing protein [Escovopsis weberi]|uniref:TBC domain-containing protein n=1 Tax=Escovopsis weberi TaxID=150374 RepID=A0A0M9VXM4_ESCWE|nr:TBC domain-containing protein [Escovopsis weberi]